MIKIENAFKSPPMNHYASPKKLTIFPRCVTRQTLFSKEGEAFATWTHKRGMVNLAKDYFTHDIIALKLVKEFEPQINVAFGKKWERLRNVMVKEAKTVRLSPERQSGKRKKKKIFNPREISGASS